MTVTFTTAGQVQKDDNWDLSAATPKLKLRTEKVDKISLTGFLEVTKTLGEKAELKIVDCTGSVSASFYTENKSWKYNLVCSIDSKRPYRVLGIPLRLHAESLPIIEIVIFCVDYDAYFLLSPLMIMSHRDDTKIIKKMSELKLDTTDKENLSQNELFANISDKCQKDILLLLIKGRQSHKTGMTKEAIVAGLNETHDEPTLEKAFESLLDSSCVFETIPDHFDTF